MQTALKLAMHHQPPAEKWHSESGAVDGYVNISERQVLCEKLAINKNVFIFSSTTTPVSKKADSG
jgi:hypothetical protein